MADGEYAKLYAQYCTAWARVRKATDERFPAGCRVALEPIRGPAVLTVGGPGTEPDTVRLLRDDGSEAGLWSVHYLRRVDAPVAADALAVNDA